MRNVTTQASAEIRAAVHSRTKPNRQKLLDAFKQGVEQLKNFPYSGTQREDLTSADVLFKLVADEWWLIYRPEPFSVVACIRAGTPLGGLLYGR